MTADRGPSSKGRMEFAGKTVQSALIDLGSAFRSAGLDTPMLDARLLIAAACDLGPEAVLLAGERTIAADEADRLQAFAGRRLAREPVARILGYRHFHGLRLEITPATLDPRPETETLVDGVLELHHKGDVPNTAAPRLLDLGTGSGAILIALLKALPGARGMGVDRSAAALAVAARNAHVSGVGQRAVFEVSDWLGRVEGKFDVIVANPPYIPRAVIATLDPEVGAYDPLPALDGGADGLDAYRLLIPQALAHLSPGGWLVLEIGEDQAPSVISIARDEGGGEIRVWKDLAGKPRCVAIKHQ